MKRGGRRNGYVMLEVMTVIAVLMAAAASMLMSASAMNRREIRKIEKNEAYAAAITAVRLMADVVINDGEESPYFLTLESGMTARETEIVVRPKDGSDILTVPVTIWTEREDDCLILYGESAVGGQKETAALILKTEGETRLATSSSASYGGWRPVRYRRAEDSKEKE